MVVAAAPLLGIVYATWSRVVSLQNLSMRLQSGQKLARRAKVVPRSRYEATCSENAASFSSVISNNLNGATIQN